MRNLGSMTIRVWDDRFDNPYSSPLASLSNEAWSAMSTNGSELQLSKGLMITPGHSLIRLTSTAVQHAANAKPLDFCFKNDHHELRLPTADASHSTRQREDLEIVVPYTAKDFRHHKPSSFICASCGMQVADLSAVTRYNDLPSEHWAELLDAWMCHQDQSISEELIVKGNNIWPKSNQALLSSTAMVITAENATSWSMAEDMEVSKFS